jgi:hypothetical protein
MEDFMTGNAKNPVGPKPKSPSRISIFGPAPILGGEDPKAYDDLLADVSSAVKPSDFIEEIWIHDVVYHVWDGLRWRRIKASLLTAAVLTQLKDILFTLVRKRSAREEEKESAPTLNLDFAPSPPSPEQMRVSKLVEKWARRDPAAIHRVDKLLSSANITMDSVKTKAFMDQLGHIECIDRFIAIAEERCNRTLREIDRRRSTFATSLREAVQHIEEAEFKTITPKIVTSKVEQNKTAA